MLKIDIKRGDIFISQGGYIELDTEISLKIDIVPQMSEEEYLEV